MTFTGRLDEPDLMEHLARCRAVVFVAARRGLRVRHRRGVRIGQGRHYLPGQRGTARTRPRRAEWLDRAADPHWGRACDRRSHGRPGRGRASGAPGATGHQRPDLGECRQETCYRVAFGTEPKRTCELRHSARNAPGQESHARDRRIRPDRGRRPRDGRPVGRQGQLGALPDSGRAAPARADLVFARRRQRQFRIRTVSPRPGVEACAARGWECRVEHTTIGAIMDDMLDDGDTPCSLCARLRRGVLYRLASEVGATKIALGHHMDDFIETALLNLFFQGSLKAMPARLVSDSKKHVVIRPAGVRDRGRGPGVHGRGRAAGHRVLLSGVRRPQPEAAAHQASDRRPGGRTSRHQELDDCRARQRRARAICSTAACSRSRRSPPRSPKPEARRVPHDASRPATRQPGVGHRRGPRRRPDRARIGRAGGGRRR